MSIQLLAVNGEQVFIDCPECGGSGMTSKYYGYDDHDTCRLCKGSGETTQQAIDEMEKAMKELEEMYEA